MARSFMRAVIAGALLCATAAVAQPVPDFMAGRFRFNDGAASGLAAASGDLLAPGQLRLLAAIGYEREPLVFFRDGVTIGSPVSSRLGAHLSAAYGLYPWLQVGGELPLVLSQSGDDLRSFGLGNPASAGVGSPFASARIALFTQRDGGLLGAQSGADVAFQLGASLPLGTGGAYATEPGIVIVPQLSAGRSFGGFRLGGEASVVVRPTASEVTLTGYAPTALAGNQLAARAIASTTGDGARYELSGHFAAALDGGTIGMELLAGARFPVWRLELFALGGPGFGELPGTPAFRVLAGVSLRPKAEKPPRKEVPLPPPPVLPTPPPPPPPPPPPSEEVPLLPPPVIQPPKVLDRDFDGVPDESDACPDEPGPESRQGCPIRDSDGDGILDNVDACPTEPGPPERLGCPIRDADGDGVPDERDACPSVAGPADNRGCPYTDRDGDAVWDHVDNCPEVPGPADNQGCPVKVKQLVVITAEKIVIKDAVYFATAKAQILAKSFPLLTQIASVLKAHPEIPRLVIEGHTDSVGKREANVKLSQARADAVRGYLLKQGIVGARLSSIGFGPDRPANDNDTEDGRAKNRRVEFMIDWEAKPASEPVAPPPAVKATAKPGNGKPLAPPPAVKAKGKPGNGKPAAQPADGKLNAQPQPQPQPNKKVK